MIVEPEEDRREVMIQKLKKIKKNFERLEDFDISFRVLFGLYLFVDCTF